MLACSLLETGIEPGYVEAIADMYADLHMHVHLGAGWKSRSFQVKKGVRQGDPLSPLIFIAVLRQVMGKCIRKWNRLGRGIDIGTNEDGHHLMYLAFADDMTLFARSRRALQQMLNDIRSELATVGLKLNMDKCVVQCSGAGSDSTVPISVGEDKIMKVSAKEGFKVLGTIFTLTGGTEREIAHRISCAWGKFYELWPILKRKDTSVHKRLKLFNAVVGRSVLWGCESWTLSRREMRRLRSVQREMMRRFGAGRRRPDEDYIQWIRRATREAETTANQAGVAGRVQQYLRPKMEVGRPPGTHGAVQAIQLGMEDDNVARPPVQRKYGTISRSIPAQTTPDTPGAMEALGRLLGGIR